MLNIGYHSTAVLCKDSSVKRQLQMLLPQQWNKQKYLLQSPVLDEVLGALDVNSLWQIKVFGGSSAESSLACSEIDES